MKQHFESQHGKKNSVVPSHGISGQKSVHSGPEIGHKGVELTDIFLPRLDDGKMAILTWEETVKESGTQRVKRQNPGLSGLGRATVLQIRKTTLHTPAGFKKAEPRAIPPPRPCRLLPWSPSPVRLRTRSHSRSSAPGLWKWEGNWEEDVGVQP